VFRTERRRKELIAELEGNARAVIERIERDPDGRFAALRQAKVETEVKGSRKPIDAFMRRLKRGDFDRDLSKSESDKTQTN
jgi:hypothetical protein